MLNWKRPGTLAESHLSIDICAHSFFYFFCFLLDLTLFKIPTQTGTQRRRNRRQRQSARRDWFLHRKGLVILNRARLKRVRQTLSAHHSRDNNFLLRISKQIVEMELWPWRCTNCQRINKKQAIKCVLCAAHWTSGTRHNT